MIDPATILFTAERNRVGHFDDEDAACRGCLFEKERSSVCHRAGAEAKARGLRDCEDGFVYVAVKVDPRQQDLFGV